MRHSLTRTARSNLAFLARAAMGVLLYTLLIGCAAAPDPRPFATQTQELAESVQRIGTMTQVQLSAAGLGTVSSDFALAWSARERAMRAAHEYSRSLEAIFAKARSAQPAALSESLQRLAAALGVGGAINAAGVQASGVLGATADTIAFIHAQIALAAVAHGLEQALTRAQPVIERLARLILADIGDLESIARAGASLQRLELTAEFNDALAFSASLDRRRSEIRRVSYVDLTPSDFDELARLGVLRASLATELEPYFARLAGINTQESNVLSAIEMSERDIRAWAAAHQRLVDAARARETIEPSSPALAITDPRTVAAHRGSR